LYEIEYFVVLPRNGGILTTAEIAPAPWAMAHSSLPAELNQFSVEEKI
jgi:hypothetical protein